jgi:hypothetical protein
MTSRVLGDLTPESLTPSVNAPLVHVLILFIIFLAELGAPSSFLSFLFAAFYCFLLMYLILAKY